MKTYTISNLAQEFNVTTRAIRFYEDQGLLSPGREGQKRIYSNQDYVRLKLIVRGKRLGFTLAESKEIISMYEPGGDNQAQSKLLLNRIAKHRERLLQKRHDVDVMLAELERTERAFLKP